MNKIASFIVSIILSSLAIYSSIYASDNPNSANISPTFCFDNNSSLSYWNTLNPSDHIEFSYDICEYSYSGDGALLISKGESQGNCEEKEMAGIYITASDFGLENFGGCTVEMRTLIDNNLSDSCKNISVFSDGDGYISQEISPANKGHWTIASLHIPNGTNNNSVGITVPKLKNYSGAILSIDDFVVYDCDGNYIKNVGDVSGDVAEIISNYSLSMIYTNLFILVISLILIITLIFLIVQKHNEKRSNPESNKNNNEER